MSNHRVRKNLANQTRDREIPAKTAENRRISEQAFGSRYADELRF